MKTTQKTFHLHPGIMVMILLLTFYCTTGFSYGPQSSGKKAADTTRPRLGKMPTVSDSVQRNRRIIDSIRIAGLESQISQLKADEAREIKEIQLKAEEIRMHDSLATAIQKGRIDSIRNIASGYPVAPFLSDTLYVVYSPLAGYSAHYRSISQSANIREMADDYLFNPDSVKIVANEITTNLMYNDKVLLGITDIDALWEHMDRDQLANLRHKQIVAAVKAYRDETNWKSLLIKTGIALLIIAALSFIIYMTNRLFRWIRRRIETIGAETLKGIRIKGYALLDTEREIKIVVWIIQGLKWLTFLLIVYLTFPVLFLLFPWTEHLSSALLDLILDPFKSIGKAFLNYLPNLATMVVIIIVFRALLKGLKFLKKEVETEALKVPGFHPELANPTYQIARVLILAFMLVVIFPYLPGSDSPVL